jgi:hypothetical protein
MTESSISSKQSEKQHGSLYAVSRDKQRVLTTSASFDPENEKERVEADQAAMSAT